MMALRLVLGGGLATATLLAAHPGSAAPCGRPDVDVTFPPSDATSVPPNGSFSAHYSSPALYDDEAVSLIDAQGDEVPVEVAFDEAESLLRATPSQPLEPGFHELAWPGLRSLTGAGVGRGRTVSFFVSPSADVTPPTFAGLRAIDWDLSRDRDPCLDRLDDRFVFQLDLFEADDDAGRELLRVVVFQTREPGVPLGEPTRVALRGFPESGRVEVRRPADRAGKTCFAAVVQDLLGSVSGGGEREVCVETQKPPFFDGCGLTRARARDSIHAWWPALLLALGWIRRGARAARRAES